MGLLLHGKDADELLPETELTDHDFIVPQGTRVDISRTLPETHLALGYHRWRLGPVPDGDLWECRAELEVHLWRGPETWGNLLAMLDPQ